VLADLSGEYLSSAVAGGLRVVKVSRHERSTDSGTTGEGVDELIAAMCRLRAEGAATVLVTRAERPALALIGDEVFEVVTPRLEEADPRGAGDSTTAGIAASLAYGDSVPDAIRTGVAAGALNVTRHGLGTGRRDAVAQIKERVRLVPIWSTKDGQARGEGPDVQATPEQLAERVRRR
jgi:1-phosphofructokinase